MSHLQINTELFTQYNFILYVKPQLTSRHRPKLCKKATDWQHIIRAEPNLHVHLMARRPSHDDESKKK